MKISMHLWQRPDNGRWYVVFPGDKRRALKTTDEAEAKRLYKEIRKQWLAGKLRDISGESNVTLKEFRKEYLEWAEKVQPKPTFRANRLALNKLIKITGENLRLSQITYKHLDQLIAKNCKLSNASLNNYIRHIRSVMNKPVEWGYTKTNPLQAAKELPVEKNPPKYISKDQLSHFLNSISDIDLRRLVTAYLATGRRRTELIALRWEHIEWERNRYLVARAKRHLSRYYPLSQTFRTTLESVGPKDQGRIWVRWTHPDTISHKVKDALKSAGLGHLHLHALRHTFASHFIEQGGDLRTLQDLLGHTEYRTTEIYAHVSDEHLAKEIERIRLGPVDLNGK